MSHSQETTFINQCHAECPNNNPLVRNVFVCDRCRNALYCSLRCQELHWSASHSSQCRSNSWLPIGADYVVKSGGGGGKNDTSLTTTPKQTALFQTIKKKIQDTKVLIDNDFTSDFFASLRINLQAILDTASLLYEGNKTDINKMLDLWMESRSTASSSSSSSTSSSTSESDSDDGNYRGKGTLGKPSVLGARGQGTGPSPEQAKLERWKRVTSKDHYEKSKLDKDIEFMLERGKIYSNLMDDCTKHLGPKKGGGTPKEGSIYLNLDWNDAKGTQLQWNLSSLGLQQKGKDRTLFDATANARFDWLENFGDLLEDIDGMIGLQEMKENIGRFILNQIIYPVSAIVSGSYLNFVIGGNPGAGKTEIAKKFPPLLYYLGLAPAYSPGSLPKITTRNDWIGEYEGQTAQKTRLGLLRGLGSLLIIDEAYSLVLSDKDVYGLEFINQLVNDMSEYRGLLSVMMLGYYEKIEKNILQSNDGLNRRFSLKWRIGNYSAEELFLILFYKLIDMGYVFPGSVGATKQGLREAFSSMAKSFPTKKFTPTKTFKPDSEAYDAYDSIYNILNALYKHGLFENINAAVVPVLIGNYNGMVVSGLVVDGTTVDIDMFNKKYVALKKDNVKRLNLAIFIKALVVYAIQQDIVLIKL